MEIILLNLKSISVRVPVCGRKIWEKIFIKIGFRWPRESRRQPYNEVSDYDVKDDSKFWVNV